MISAETCDRWIYGLNLAIDANFRLKLKDHNVIDPELGPGWAYFVNEEKYQEEIKKHPQPKEVCLPFAIIFRKLKCPLEKRLYIHPSSDRARDFQDK